MIDLTLQQIFYKCKYHMFYFYSIMHKSNRVGRMILNKR